MGCKKLSYVFIAIFCLALVAGGTVVVLLVLHGGKESSQDEIYLSNKTSTETHLTTKIPTEAHLTTNTPTETHLSPKIATEAHLTTKSTTKTKITTTIKTTTKTITKTTTKAHIPTETPREEVTAGLTQAQSPKHNENVLETRSVFKNVVVANDCKELLDAGFTADGVYTIYVDSSPARVECDMTNGGWTVFQHRFDGSVDFKQDFDSFTNGFGDPRTEFWFGLEKIYQMTSNGVWMMRVDMEDFFENTAYAQYRDFKVKAGPRYELAIGAYSGTAGDSLKRSNGAAFSTYDKDQGTFTENCAGKGMHDGAWWWKACGSCNLNSANYNETKRYGKAMFWYHFKGTSKPMKETMMKMRKI